VAEDKHLLKDIRLVLRHSELRPVYTVAYDLHRIRGQAGLGNDFGVISGKDNLGQAVLLRLLTPRGELAALGHPEYGSRLHELVGSPNTAYTRNLVKLYILECLQQEPRVDKVIQAAVDPAPGTHDRVNVLIQVQPVGATGSVTIGPFTLELGT
jgi:phage baseplate assembly protein W